MKRFAFKLDSLLKLRSSQRDRCQQMLAEALRRDDELVHARKQTETDRLLQINELRSLCGGGDLNVDASVLRRSYAGQLSGDISHIEAQRTILAGQIEFCRQALIRADQAVKSLEKLAE